MWTAVFNIIKVDISFTSEAVIKEENERWRSKGKSTDVISIRMNNFPGPEVVKGLDTRYLHLGDMIIAPAYVQRQCDKDKKNFDKGELDVSNDAGCSKCMATLFSVQERLPLLLIHSALHMMGHDHETEEDWKVMTKREDEVIKAFYDHYSGVAKVK